jgi:hypothetical protein
MLKTEVNHKIVCYYNDLFIIVNFIHIVMSKEQQVPHKKQRTNANVGKIYLSRQRAHGRL